MAILPVLDLLKGKIVRGIGGRRDEYRPVVSKLLDSADPVAVAKALHAHFGFEDFYLADLDAIIHSEPAFDVYTNIHKAGFRLWIDAGIRSAGETSAMLLREHSNSVVVGLESLDGPTALEALVQRAGPERIVFSLDLKAGQPLGQVKAWPSAASWSIAEHAIVALGIRRMIVLDLARVGVGEGLGTEELCCRLKKTYPQLQLTAGGGVNGIDDVKRLQGIGVDHVLVASALHDGRISPDDVRRL